MRYLCNSHGECPRKNKQYCGDAEPACKHADPIETDSGSVRDMVEKWETICCLELKMLQKYIDSFGGDGKC